ncbi:hypothetical protein K402DRAFT_403030 [Aulographum hederae CBS 113979]|uniref:Uncharacterized protein n=1 Tax=Aulographum hederae CBS 113979 TaxID=1176131 RepID=A0A6G1H5C2_9PEZI|nr:hypothetical protein K402DRAFT_403030 [Aulographum hederae CBS 113979]
MKSIAALFLALATLSTAAPIVSLEGKMPDMSTKPIALSGDMPSDMSTRSLLLATSSGRKSFSAANKIVSVGGDMPELNTRGDTVAVKSTPAGGVVPFGAKQKREPMFRFEVRGDTEPVKSTTGGGVVPF